MLFANVCAGFIRSCYGEFWEWHFFGLLASHLCLVCLGSASFAGVSLLRTRLGLLWCASCWTRFLASFGGSIAFVTTGGNVRQIRKLLTFICGFMNIS